MVGPASETELEIELFNCLQDNFGVLVYDPSSGICIAIDAPEGKPIRDALQRRGWTLTHALITHHHHDHVGGLENIGDTVAFQVAGPEELHGKVPQLSRTVTDNESLALSHPRDPSGRKLVVQVIATPGHTLGHVVYYFPESSLLFAGDTLFSMGCGRVFEGSHEQMYASLTRLSRLPVDTTVYFGHEYSLVNAGFALKLFPDDPAIRLRHEEIVSMRSEGLATAPTSIGLENKTNPFLRCTESDIRRKLRLDIDASALETFSTLRYARDSA